MTPGSPERSEQLARDAAELATRSAAGAERTTALRKNAQRPGSRQTTGGVDVAELAGRLVFGDNSDTRRLQASRRREEHLPWSTGNPTPGAAHRPVPITLVS